MLKRFEVTNYKNFKDTIIIDFSKVGGYQFNKECITNGLISKMLIYGRNATGKTNLGRALIDIAYLGTGNLRFPVGLFANADTIRNDAEFKYVFQFAEDEVIYRYSRLNESVILEETLFVNGEKVFYYNSEKGHLEINDLKMVDAETAVIERFLEAVQSNEGEDGSTLPFLRWLINNTALQDNSILLKLNDYIKRMSTLSVSAAPYRTRAIFESFFELLGKDDNLADFEEFLNKMGVECQLGLKTLPDGKKDLYFIHSKPISFVENASSGTIALMNLYIRLMMRKDMSLLYIDEFDAFYHYEMSEKVVEFFKYKYPNCQVVMTTHNTNLMSNSLMRPDCLFILSVQGCLTALCDATQRELREGHNLEKLYISGEFGAHE